MEFITLTLAVLDFIAYISKNTIRDQSFFQYWNCHIIKHSISNCTAYKILWIISRPNASFETLYIYLLKHYIPNIWQQHHVNFRSTYLWRHTSKRTFINRQPIFIPCRFYSKKDCLTLIYKNNSFLISLPFDLNI